MNLILDLPPEVTNDLETKAAKVGVPLEHYAAGVLRRETQSNGTSGEATRSSQTRQTARRALEALAAGTREGLPPIPDEALSSESFYAGRGE